MTASQIAHLIEQFAEQCPLAIWILDSRGIAIFANSRLHEMLDIKRRPSGALGMNILSLPMVERMGLTDERDRLMKGEHVSVVVRSDDPQEDFEGVEVGRKKPVTLRAVAYALKSSSQSMENFVIFLEDITDTDSRNEEIEERTHDIRTFLRSQLSRKDRLDELSKEVETLRKRIEELGQTPEA